MTKFAVIKTGGKQYLVKEGDEIVVDRLENKEQEKIELETLMIFTDDGDNIEIGSPFLKEKTQAEIVSHEKGEKIRIARFKAKVRYRKVKGFRPQLTTLKIIKIN
ncbi:MAG: 50S ribosomal protein L21 [Patescibacteria group bacterium]|nr:MAG: 50S ribosomal protein L21 [Patescibacteria group bacterium]